MKIIKYVSVALLIFASTTSSLLANDGEKERQSSIKAARALYAGYVQEKAIVPEVKDFARVSGEKVFGSAVVIPIKAGHILYNPMNGITFVLVNMGKAKVLKGLGPSELFSLTGQPALKNSDQHLQVTFVRVPQAIETLRGKIASSRSDQVLDILAQANGSQSSYPDEVENLLVGPYVRGARYAECLNQIDSSKVKRQIEVNLLNAAMPEHLKAGFELLDFIPISENEGMMVHASRLGLLYVLSAVDMTGTCKIKESWYKTL